MLISEGVISKRIVSINICPRTLNFWATDSRIKQFYINFNNFLDVFDGLFEQQMDIILVFVRVIRCNYFQLSVNIHHLLN